MFPISHRYKYSKTAIESALICRFKAVLSQWASFHPKLTGGQRAKEGNVPQYTAVLIISHDRHSHPWMMPGRFSKLINVTQRKLTSSLCVCPLCCAQKTSHNLHWSIGDSGGQKDPEGHGQNLSNIHGTMVRITVPTIGTGYKIPAGNININTCK